MTPQTLARRATFLLPGALVLALTLLSACAAQPSVSAAAQFQDRDAMAGIRTYRVEFKGMPEFLKPMLRDEVSRVLAANGYDYTEGDAHAVLLMGFENRPMPSVTVATGADSSAAAETRQEIAARFDAQVMIELRDSVSQARLWSGTMSRAHYVTDGAYMHESPARVAMRDAFRVIFAGLPNRLERIMAPE